MIINNNTAQGKMIPEHTTEIPDSFISVTIVNK